MSPSSPYRTFALLYLVSLVLWRYTLVAAFGLALQNNAYTHILLILPICAALIFMEWRSRKAQPEPDFRAGLVLLVLAILIGFIGGRWGPARLRADMRLFLDMLAVVTWWIGSFVCCFGTRISRMSIFPLCFLLLLVPLPEFALTHIVSFLQQGSAYVANLLFVIVGVPATQDGLRLTIPGLTLEVAEECSSLQQYSLQPAALSHHYGAGSPLASFRLGQRPCHSGGNSSFDCQERVSNLHPVDACSLCRSKLPAWLATSPGRNSVLPGISGGLVRPTAVRRVGRAQTDSSTGAVIPSR